MQGILLTDYEPTIRIETDNEGRITQGLTIGDILSQNQAIILQIHPGELKEHPAVGCGISDMLLDHDPLFMRSLIREQMELDGQTVRHVHITSTTIEIDAYY